MIELLLDGESLPVTELKKQLPDNLLAIFQCLRDNQLLTPYNCKRLLDKDDADEYELFPVLQSVLNVLSLNEKLNRPVLDKILGNFDLILGLFTTFLALDKHATALEKEELISKLMFLLDKKVSLILIEKLLTKYLTKYKYPELFHSLLSSFSQEHFLSWLNAKIVLLEKRNQVSGAGLKKIENDYEGAQWWHYKMITPSIDTVARALDNNAIRETYQTAILQHLHPSQLAVALSRLESFTYQDSSASCFTEQNIAKLIKHPYPLVITTWLFILNASSALTNKAAELVFEYANPESLTYRDQYDPRGLYPLIKTLDDHHLLIKNLSQLLTFPNNRLSDIEGIVGRALYYKFPIDQTLLDAAIAIKKDNYFYWGLVKGVKTLAKTQLEKTTANFLKVLIDSVHWDSDGIFIRLYKDNFKKDNLSFTQQHFDTLNELAEKIKDKEQLEFVVHTHLDSIIDNSFIVEDFVANNPQAVELQDKQTNSVKPDDKRLKRSLFIATNKVMDTYSKAKLAAEKCEKQSQSLFSRGMKNKGNPPIFNRS